MRLERWVLKVRFGTIESHDNADWWPASQDLTIGAPRQRSASIHVRSPSSSSIRSFAGLTLLIAPPKGAPLPTVGSWSLGAIAFWAAERAADGGKVGRGRTWHARSSCPGYPESAAQYRFVTINARSTPRRQWEGRQLGSGRLDVGEDVFRTSPNSVTPRNATYAEGESSSTGCSILSSRVSYFRMSGRRSASGGRPTSGQLAYTSSAASCPAGQPVLPVTVIRT